MEIATRRAVATAAGSAVVMVAMAIAGCGASSGAGDPRTALTHYLDALSRGDAKGACGQLSGASRDDLAAVGTQLLLVPGATCEQAVAQVLRSEAGPRVRLIAAAQVGRVERRGDAAKAYVPGLDTPVRLVRDGHGWRVAGRPVVEAE